jgi:hypothetical protein
VAGAQGRKPGADDVADLVTKQTVLWPGQMFRSWHEADAFGSTPKCRFSFTRPISDRAPRDCPTRTSARPRLSRRQWSLDIRAYGPRRDQQSGCKIKTACGDLREMPFDFVRTDDSRDRELGAEHATAAKFCR